MGEEIKPLVQNVEPFFKLVLIVLEFFKLDCHLIQRRFHRNYHVKLLDDMGVVPVVVSVDDLLCFLAACGQ